LASARTSIDFFTVPTARLRVLFVSKITLGLSPTLQGATFWFSIPAGRIGAPRPEDLLAVAVEDA